MDDDERTSSEIPDLAAIPRDQWKEALRRVRSFSRRAAVQRLLFKEGGAEAVLLELELEHEEAERHLNGPPAPAPPRTTAPASADPARRVRQVNLKLQPREYTDLVHAAERLGVRPTVLARLLVKRGVELALRA